MPVNEAGGDYMVIGGDDMFRVVTNLSNADDFAVAIANVPAKAWIVGTIDYRAILDE
jgi:hypothetical protein